MKRKQVLREGMLSQLKRIIRGAPLIGPAIRHAVAYRAIMPRDELHEFWRSPRPEGNVPRDYISAEALPRSEALVALLFDHARTDRILEIGCNAGRNLAFLFDAGFMSVEGVEISPHAVALLRSTYPQLANRTIHLGAAEDVLAEMADASFDLVFTMAVLEHIHPDSTELFAHMARIGHRILAIEPREGHSSTRQFPHCLRRRFARHGMKLVWVAPMEGDLAGYDALYFER